MAKKKEIKNIEELLQEALISKEEQPYEIPSNWEWVRLGSINIINPSKEKFNIADDELCSFLPMRAISDENGEIIEIFEESYGKVKIGYTSFKENDVLFAKITPCMENGKCALAKGLKNGIGFGTTEFHILRPIYSFPELIHYFLRDRSFRLEAARHMTGSVGQKRVPKQYLEDHPFPLPPLSEQIRIVNKLEAMLSKLKEAKEKIAESKESFELRRASILHKAFTGELTKQWREEKAVNSEELTVNSLLEKINEEKLKTWEDECRKADLEGKKKPSKPKLKTVEEMKISDDEKPYDLPQGWEWLRLGDVALFQNGYAFKSDEFVEKGIQIVRMGNLYMNRFDLSRNPVYISEGISKEIKDKYSIKNNDILLSLTGTKYKRDYGYAIFMTDINQPILLNQRILALRFSVILSRFAHSYLQTNIFRDKFFSFETGGVNQGNVGSSSVESIHFPLPPLSEQQEIVARIEALLKAEEDAKELLNMEEQIDLLEKSILSKAFRGELGTNDSSDEPALELLKRVLGE